MRQWRGVPKTARALLLLGASVLATACERQEVSLRILGPGFGPGSAQIEIQLGPGYVEGSLQVSLGGTRVTDAFVRTPDGARAVLPLAPGPHPLAAQARFRRGAGQVSQGDGWILRLPWPAPPLVSSDPPGSSIGVPRTSWLRLEFARAVARRTLHTFRLRCDGVELPASLHRLGPETVVVNPEPELPEATSCDLAWTGPGGVASIAFETAVRGAPATVIYDREDPRSTAPFPDDLWLVSDPERPTGQRLAIPPPQGPADFELVTGSLLAEANLADGFSPLGPMVVELSEAADPDSVPNTREESLDPLASVGLFDLNPGPGLGSRLPFQAQVRTDTSLGGVTSHTLLLFPSLPLDPRGRYGLVVTRRAQADATRPFGPSPGFAAALAPPLPGESDATTRARALAREVLAALSAHGRLPVPAEDVALVLRISVRSLADLPRDLLAIREQVFAAPAPPLQLDACLPIQDPRCLDQDDPSSAVSACVLGSFESPDWREQGSFARGPDGLPVPVTLQDVPFVLALPRAAPGERVPVTFYQHGNPGSAEREVPGEARRTLAGAGFAVAGFTDNLNREVTPGVTDSEVAIQGQIFAVLVGILGRQRIPDYWAQTNAEQLVFLRALESLAAADLTGFCAGAGILGVPGLDLTRPLTYLGISQGANHAPGFLPYAPEIRAAALVVGGARLVEVLVHQGADTIVPTLGTFFPSLTPAETWFGFALFQGNFDRQDQHNHARFLFRDPLPLAGSTRRASLLLVEGLDDSFVPNHATESLAWLLGPLPHLRPVRKSVPFLEQVTGPVVANLDSETTAAFSQFVPVGIRGVDPTPGCVVLAETSAREGHFCAQVSAEAILQRTAFLESALTDPAPTIIDPLAP